MFTTFQDSAGAWRWRSQGSNGEKDAQSEAYTREADAERGARDHAATVLLDIVKALAANESTLSLAHPPPVRVGCDAIRHALSSLAENLDSVPLVHKE